MSLTRNAQKTFIALHARDGGAVFVNPSQVTRVEALGDKVIRIYSTDGHWFALEGDIDDIVDLLEEGLI